MNDIPSVGSMVETHEVTIRFRDGDVQKLYNMAAGFIGNV